MKSNILSIYEKFHGEKSKVEILQVETIDEEKFQVFTLSSYFWAWYEISPV